jgi:hypothetical protein
LVEPLSVRKALHLAAHAADGFYVAAGDNAAGIETLLGFKRN